ncbi:cation transporter [Kordiimonas sp.]|uniref:cation transporter n=1 Tax=Kordiimonas sp. TaxID=1970157 RepID=UPI003A8F47E6
MRTIPLAISAICLSAFPVGAAEQSVEFSVPGMFCASCPFVVKAAMSKVDGVLGVETNLEARMAYVRYDDAITTIAAIQDASANAGYEAIVSEGTSQH